MNLISKVNIRCGDERHNNSNFQQAWHGVYTQVWSKTDRKYKYLEVRSNDTGIFTKILE